MITPMELYDNQAKKAREDGTESMDNPSIQSDHSPTDPIKAIDAACFECYGGTRFDIEISQEIQDAIKKCTSKYACSLHKLRPYK